MSPAVALPRPRAVDQKIERVLDAGALGVGELRQQLGLVRLRRDQYRRRPRAAPGGEMQRDAAAVAGWAASHDYDAIRRERPLSTPPSVGPGRVVWFQLWHWDGDQYELEMFQLHEAESWRVVVGKARYWAITRDEITELAERAGFGYVEWLLHAYYQPLMIATNG